MKISSKFVLGLVAVLAFAAVPVFASSHTSHSHGTSKSNPSGGKTVSDKLSDNTKLSQKLQGLLPQGTNLQTAAQGFKNLGQFVAAVHVSNNLDIPWDQFRSKMIGPPSQSMGKTIQALKPAANAKAETKKAKKQAKQDINDSKAS